MKQAITLKNPFPQNYSQERLIITKGCGVWLEDSSGKTYLDFGAGIAVNALGYGREDLAKIAYNQMTKLIHISNLYITEPAIELANKLVKGGPVEFEAVHFGNSGSEANEAALKYARLYSLRTRGKENYKILSFKNAFHGRTFGALSCTPNEKYQAPFKPLLQGMEAGIFNDINDLKKRLDSSFAGVIVEVVQGEGGLEVMTSDFADALNNICRKNDIILIADEIQTGLSRTGSLYACQDVGLKPDILTLAKPLAAGLPLSATLIPRKVNSIIKLGEHGTTFGGGPVTTAVACKVWDILSDSDFIKQVKSKGRFIASNLKEMSVKYSFLGQIKGLGLLQGIEIFNVDISEVIKKVQEQGLLLLRSGQNVLRLAPALIISEEELAKGFAILDRVFSDFQKEEE